MVTTICRGCINPVRSLTWHYAALACLTLDKIHNVSFIDYIFHPLMDTMFNVNNLVSARNIVRPLRDIKINKNE
jgi:hypothetical protein